jgi:hypothetical protein
MSEVLSSGLTLTIPSEGDSNWATSIKNNCFQKISEHDHTGAGNGVQIATAAIANLAVTSAKIDAGAVTESKLGDNSVTRDKIFNLEVTTGKIANGAVTEAKLDDDAATRSTVLSRFFAAPLSGTGTGAYSNAYDFTSGQNINQATMPKTGKVTHLTIQCFNALSGGNITATLYKNNVTTSQSISLTSGDQRKSAAITAVSFVANDYLEVRYSSDASFNGGAKQLIDLWGHFTE